MLGLRTADRMSDRRVLRLAGRDFRRGLRCTDGSVCRPWMNVGEAFCGIDWAETTTTSPSSTTPASGYRPARPASERCRGPARATWRCWPASAITRMIRSRSRSRSRTACWWPACASTGRQVFTDRPTPVSRYRDRTGSRKKSDEQAAADPGQDLAHPDMAAHRPLPADSDLARAITVLASRPAGRGLGPHQLGQPSGRRCTTTASPQPWRRLRICATAMSPRPRPGSSSRWRPSRPRRPPPPGGQLRAALKRAGRVRHVDQDVERLHAIFHAEHMRLPDLVEQAMGHQYRTARPLDATCKPSRTSPPRSGGLYRAPRRRDHHQLSRARRSRGARVLAEIGDDRSRFADARALKAYAGAAPVTERPARASPSWPAGSRTSAWPPSATYGRTSPP